MDGRRKKKPRCQKREYIHRPRRPRGKRITEEEIEFFTELYEEKDKTLSQIVNKTGMSRATVVSLARKLGLNRSNRYYRKYPSAKRGYGQKEIEYIVDGKAKRAMLEIIMSGGSVQELIREGYIPNTYMFIRLLSKDENFKKDYENARKVGTDMFIDQLIDLSSSVITDEKLDPNRVRIAADLKKALAKMINPDVYGDKQTISHKSEEIKPPTINIFAGGKKSTDKEKQTDESDEEK